MGADQHNQGDRLAANTKHYRVRERLEDITTSLSSRFYPDIWGCDARMVTSDIEHTPPLNRRDIATYPFNDRLYLQKGLFVKVVRANNETFLVARTKYDISEEDFGPTLYSRPLVIFDSPHESLEKGLWLYGKNLLPLIAEDNVTVTLLAASRFKIDALLCDNISLGGILREQNRYFSNDSIIQISLIDANFDAQLFSETTRHFPRAHITPILALPEAGAVGCLCTQSTIENRVFHSTKDVYATISPQNTLVVTRLSLLPTPLYGYDTEIRVQRRDHICSCASEISFSLRS